MSTSLAEQLQRLAVPQTSLLNQDKKRPSILFDPREAAGLKRDYVYEIGLNGIEELINKNPIFEQYKNNLFSITSKSWERAVTTDDVNKLLNKCIRKFLLHLSPYFLFPCSHNALEWLVNRFLIHEYNKEDLLMLVMPYHECNIFVRVIQLLKFKEHNDPWIFLKPLQKKANAHLTKQALLTHAANDLHFLKFVTKSMQAIIKVHAKPTLLTVQFNYYCAVFSGAVEYSAKISDSQIGQMMPSILQGLHSDISDYCAASYVILSRLLTKTTLSNIVLDKFVQRIVQAKVDSLKTETVLILLVLYQSQTQYDTLPEEACSDLLEKQWMIKILEDLNVSGSYIDPFLGPLIRTFLNRAIKLDEEKSRNYIITLLTIMKFPDDFIETFLSAILDAAKSKDPYPDHVKKFITDTIETLERQYPEQFDKEIYNILSSTETGIINKRKKCLQRILTETMGHRGKFDVFDKLYHPNAKYRSQAIDYLAKNLDKLREGEKEMIKSSFIDRLNDDNEEVVSETLDLIKSTNIVDFTTLKSELIKLANKCQKDLDKWQTISVKVIEILCETGQPDDWNIFLAVFPYLLPSKKSELKRAVKIVDTKFIKENTLLKLKEVPEEYEHFCNNIFDSLKNDSLERVQNFVATLQKVCLEDRDVLHKYFATLILSCILPENSPIKVNVLVIEIFSKYFYSCEAKSDRSTAAYQQHISSARKGKFDLEAFLLCVKNVIVKTEKPSLDLGLVDFQENNDVSRYFVILAKTLFRNLSTYKKYIKQFLDYFCKDLQSKVKLLLNLILCNHASLDLMFQQSCLKTILTLVSDTDADLSSFLDWNESTTPYILAILCNNKSSEIRRTTLEIIEILVKKKQTNSFWALLNGILTQKEEIILDEEQTPLVMFNLLATSARGKKASDNIKQKNTLLKAACNSEYPIYLKAGLLHLLSHMNSIEIFEETAPLALNILETSETNLDNVKSAIIFRNIMKCETNIASKLHLDSQAWKFIEEVHKHDNLSLSIDGKNEFATILLLNQFDENFMKAVTEEVRTKIFDLIIERVTVTKNPEILSSANKIFKSTEIEVNVILDHFVKMRDALSPKLDPSKLKRRKSFVPTIDILDTLEWRKGVTALEIIPDKKNIKNPGQLFSVLFELLKKCLDFDEQVAVEYPKQLILSSILHLCGLTTLRNESLPENVFNIELIVQCIRASQNPQTHHHALLVLAESAMLVPSQVLHHIMAIFTFMGSSVLRHDDVYSYQIIMKIMDTIIPILLQDKSQENIPNVLRVFVDALLDVPEHRRKPLYKQLLDKIGANEHLYIFLLLVVESHVMSPRAKDKSEESMRRLNIAAELSREYLPETVILTCIELMKYLKDLPDEFESDNANSPFNIQFKRPKQFRHYKYSLITFMASLLASEEFVTKVASLNSGDCLSLETVFKDMVINVLTFIQRVSKVADKNLGTPQAQYWKIILHHSYDILDSVNALLNSQMFFLVIKGLMLHKLSTVRRRALELLNSKLQYNMKFFEDAGTEEIYSLVPPLISIIKGINDEEESDNKEIIVQTALLSLKLLVKILAPEYPEKFSEILEFITNLMKCGKAQNNVLASLVLCLAELCVNLRANCIASLPNFMPVLLKVLKQQKVQETSNLLLMSSVTALQKIVDTLPLFLSPYLEKLLIELCLLTSTWGESTNDPKLQLIVNKLSGLRKKIGTVIPPRILIPVVSQTYQALVEKKVYDGIGALMEILGENFSNLRGPEINANLPELTSLFLTAFQFRVDGGTSLEQANQIEEHFVKAFTKLMLKLSESNFKPLFYKIFDWAVRSEVKSERLITFYSLCYGMAECLKGIFVLFVVHLLNNIAPTLDACNKIKSETLYFEEEAKTVLLLENIMKTLNCVCSHATHRFITKERFEVLMQPLIDQLENDLDGIENLKKRNVELITPTIVQFVCATPDDFLWKQLNYQVLLKMRHSSSEIRLIALHCLTEVVKKLGEDFLPLIPETIPFLAELLEDEEEHVEKECKKAVQEMEKVLGESLTKYF